MNAFHLKLMSFPRSNSTMAEFNNQEEIKQAYEKLVKQLERRAIMQTLIKNLKKAAEYKAEEEKQQPVTGVATRWTLIPTKSTPCRALSRGNDVPSPAWEPLTDDEEEPNGA